MGQRIQRYSQGSAFKRSVLDMIAEELLREGSGGGLVEMAVPIGRNAAPIITDVQVGGRAGVWVGGCAGWVGGGG